MDKLTIGITAYNCSDYLMDAINSVLFQSVDNWNAVLVLDGMTDRRTRKLFDNFQHPKFQKYTFKENQGPFGTRAKAIEMSKTDWYFQLDSDDLLPPNAIKDILVTINNNPKAEFINGDCEIFPTNPRKINKPLFDEEMLCYSPLFNAVSPISIKLFNRIGGYNRELFINADWDFWLSVHEKNIIGAYTNSNIYKRRIRHDNIGHKFIHHRPEILEKIISRHVLFFNSDERKNKARFNVLEKLARYSRSAGNRKEAANYVRKAIKYGNSTLIFDSILKEEKMSKMRYFIRRLGREFI